MRGLLRQASEATARRLVDTDIVNVKHGGTYSNHWAKESLFFPSSIARKLLVAYPTQPALQQLLPSRYFWQLHHKSNATLKHNTESCDVPSTWGMCGSHGRPMWRWDDWQTLADVSYTRAAFACDTASHPTKLKPSCPLHVSTMYDHPQDDVSVQP
jgi:hypothetical protein